MWCGRPYCVLLVHLMCLFNNGVRALWSPAAGTTNSLFCCVLSCCFYGHPEGGCFMAHFTREFEAERTEGLR